MTPPLLLWEPLDGPATRTLRQALTWGVGALYAAATLLCLWSARGASGGAREVYVVAALVALVVVVRCVGGRLRLLDLPLLAGPALLVNAVPAVLLPQGGLVGGLMSSFFLVGATTALTRTWGLVLLGVTVAVWLVASTTAYSDQTVADALDIAALNTGMVVAEVVFLRSLVGNARVQDRLAAEQERLETAAGLDDLEHAATSVVQRVLHDDVLSALRAVADGSSASPEDVRRACRDAAAAVRAQAGPP